MSSKRYCVMCGIALVDGDIAVGTFGLPKVDVCKTCSKKPIQKIKKKKIKDKKDKLEAQLLEEQIDGIVEGETKGMHKKLYIN